jgi:hypothetical protein
LIADTLGGEIEIETDDVLLRPDRIVDADHNASSQVDTRTDRRLQSRPPQ